MNLPGDTAPLREITCTNNERIKGIFPQWVQSIWQENAFGESVDHACKSLSPRIDLKANRPIDNTPEYSSIFQ